MQSSLAEVRTHVDILCNAAAASSATGKKPRGGKTERLKAVTAIHNALTKKSTINALTAASTLEMVKGPQEDPAAAIPPLGWAELAAVLVETLQQACLDALASKAASRSGRTTFKDEFILCFKDVLKLSLTHGPSGVIRPIVPAFLYFAHQWLSEPSLRTLIADQIWQCVRDILQDDANRAMLTPPFIRTWVDVCVEQLTDRGPLSHSSSVVSQYAADVLETIARGVESYDTLTQSTKSVAPSKMLGGDFGYAIICERCCYMLVIAETKSRKSPREARELQAVAFRTLTVALTDHALDVVGSNALKSIINISLNAIIACWTDRRYHDSAVSLARILLLLFPTHRKLTEKCRQRLLADMRDERSSAVVRAGHDVKEDFIDTAAACFSFRESLQFACSPEAGQGFVIVWLRVAVSITSRRVLKKGTSLLVDAADVLDQSSTAAETITTIFRGHAKIRENSYGEILRWSTQLVDTAAVTANRVHVKIKPASPFMLETWRNLYLVLREQLTKIKYSVRSRGPTYGMSGENVQPDERLLQTVSLLSTLELLEKSTVHVTSQHTDIHRDLPYPISRIASSKRTPLALEVEYFRNLVARSGISDSDGGHLRFRLIHALVDLCDSTEGSRESPVKILIDASSAALGLARGECTLDAGLEGRNSPATLSTSSNSFISHAFGAFQSYFGHCATDERISDEGGRLVGKAKDQERVWSGTLAVLASLDGANGLSASAGVQKRTEQSGVRTTRHFSVDAVLTEDIERQVFLKARSLVQISLTKSSTYKQRTARSGSPSGRQSVGERENSFSKDPTCNTLSKVLVFIGNYLLQGISLGIVPVGEATMSTESDSCDEMVALVTQLIATFADTEGKILISQFELSMEVIRVSCQLCQVLGKYPQPPSNAEAEERSVWVDLARTTSSAMINLCAKLAECLVGTMLLRTKENLRKVQHFANGGLVDPSSQQLLTSKRKRKRSTALRGRETKRKRHLRVESDSEDSEHVVDRGSQFQDANRMEFGDEDEHPQSSSGSSESDDFGDDTIGSSRKKGKSAPHIQAWRRQDIPQFVRNTAGMLQTCIKELPIVEDIVMDILLKGMDTIDETERLLSPDGFERAALASSLVDDSFLDLRGSLWAVLFSLRTNRAIEAAAKDLHKVGVFWKELEKVSHFYVSFYVESLKITNNNRKHFPMPQCLEQMRIAYLEHARLFLENCLLPDESCVFERGGAQVQACQSSPLYLVSSIVDVAEHFRVRHAFRMPRTTRISYFKFGLAVVELFGAKSGDLLTVAERDMSQSNALQEATQAIQSALCKFLCDSEAVVRIVAAVSLPRVLVTYIRRPLSQIEVILQDSIPQSNACEESKAYYGSTTSPNSEVDRDEAVLGLQFELSADEQLDCSTISESFRNVGAIAKACTAFVALGEVAAAREDLLPLCMLQILFRALRSRSTLPAAYQIIVRLCVARGYSSPHRLYQTFARVLLPKWFKYPQAVDLLYKFPASLVVDVDHHRESVLFDWMRDQQSLLVPHLLVMDTTPSLSRTKEFAEALGLDLPTLLSTNVGPFSLVFPMQFVGSLHEKGSALWHAIDSILGGRSKILLFQNKAEVIRSFLRNTSSGVGNRRAGDDRSFDPEKALGFARDTREVRPPFYDPLVVALAINQLFELDSSILIIQRSVLKGSLFSEVRDELNGEYIAESFNGFLEECQRSKVFLLRVLLTISRFLLGPPNPQPSKNRLDGYFCVGMLWRMLGVNVLVKSSSERVIFYRLMAKGFEYHETAHDAAWLLLEVQRKVSSMEESHPDVKVHATDLSIDPSKRDYLLCMTSSRERQMYELLSAVSPILVLIVSQRSAFSSDVLRNTALAALNSLLQLCHDEGLWTVILSNGPYPTFKYLSKARRLYESSKATVELSTAEDGADTVVASLNRFQGIYRLRNDAQSLTTAFACVQELRSLLSDSAVRKLSRRMKREAWVRSDGQDEPTVPHVRRAIACLINLVYETEKRVRNPRTEEHFGSIASSGMELKGLSETWGGMLHEIADVLGVLGLLQPQSATYIRSDSHQMSIPALSQNDRYEDVKCGIRMSLFLLLKMLHGPSSITAESALTTLIEILRTDDGRKVYGNDKRSLDVFTPFRNAARKLVVNGLPSIALVAYDPSTGEEVSTTSFPSLVDPRLWSIEENTSLHFADYEMWMRRFCCVLSKRCGSDALKTLSSSCYISYQFACEMLPYLLMDIVNGLDRQSLSEVSLLFRQHILSNHSTPIQILRVFVHALDVMCQIGLDVIYQRGVSQWIHKRENAPVLRWRYVLEIPYIDAAKAALRGGSYFSVVRFSQMHIDQQVADREFRILAKGMSQKTDRRHSSCPSRDSSLERVEQVARDDVRELVRIAMMKINEPDGVRAFGNDENLPKSAAGLAVLDRDWNRSLSALDIVARTDGSSSRPGGYQSSDQREGPQTVDMHRELSLFQSFIGLGTLSIAADYWHGLRSRISKVGIRDQEVVSNHEPSATDKLNDLRYAVAWKLGHWESPPLLPSKVSPDRRRDDSKGFHGAVYRVLHSFRTERFVEASETLAGARIRELRNLVGDSSGVSAGNVFQSAARLQIFRIMEDAQRQYSGIHMGQSDPWSRTGASGGESRTVPRSLRVDNGSGAGTATGRDSEPYLFSQDEPNEPKAEDVVEQILRGSFCSQNAEGGNFEVIPFRDAFDEGIHAEDLPIALVQCLSKEKEVARAAATVSARLLTAGGSGAWSRSASCLGTISSSSLRDACDVDRVAWKLQEARLRWAASHDAPSRKRALVAVKDIISKELGGNPDNGTSSTSDDTTPPQAVAWDHATNDCDKYAFLRSEACRMAAIWSLDMRTHEPMNLFETFLESGLRAVNSSAKAKHLAGPAHFAMATFADAQLSNIDTYRKTRKYDQMVSSVREAEAKIEKLKTMKDERRSKSKGSSRRGSRSSRSEAASGGVTEHQIGRDLDLLIRNEQKKTALDRSRLEKLNETYRKWQVLACQHFAACLRDGSAQDLRAAFRLVALWLDSGQMRDTITLALVAHNSRAFHSEASIEVPVSKLLPLAPQLSSRLSAVGNIGTGVFQRALSHTIQRMAENFPAYCLWQLLALSNSTRVSANQEKYSSLYRGDKDKKDAADDILNKVIALHGETVQEMKKVADAYILLSETNDNQKNSNSLDMSRTVLVKLGELTKVPVPTVPLPLNAADYCGNLPHIVKFDKKAGICSGLSKPLKVVCYGSDGKRYPQMVKGRDDLRGDAVMEQLFTILNSLLEKDADAAKRNLLVRTYRIIPLSPFSGIMQFVSNTMQFKDVLVEKGKPSGSQGPRKSLHERYRPKDMKHDVIFQKAYQFKTRQEQPKRIQLLSQIWQRIQPVFRFFFLEQWPDPAEWFSRQLAYSRSVAVMSIVGFILGLGDRHLSNILVDVVTAEVVHIDFGIAFEQGKLLPTPERMPFRLTRDLVDGFGIAGVEGVFRRCSEVTLSVMRRNKDVLLTVVEVLLHDPMFNWALTPEEVLREQRSRDGSDRDIFESDLSRSLDESAADAVVREVNKDINGSSEAHRALNRISEKLDGLEGTERLSVEAHVARLVDEAQAFHVIASVYPGWAPWL